MTQPTAQDILRQYETPNMKRNNTLRQQCRTMIDQMSPEALAYCCDFLGVLLDGWTQPESVDRTRCCPVSSAVRFQALG